MRKMFATLEATAKLNDALGGKIAIEWPKSCDYWRLNVAQEVIAKYQLQVVAVHGCACGLVDDDGAPSKAMVCRDE